MPLVPKAVRNSQPRLVQRLSSSSSSIPAASRKSSVCLSEHRFPGLIHLCPAGALGQHLLHGGEMDWALQGAHRGCQVLWYYWLTTCFASYSPGIGENVIVWGVSAGSSLSCAAWTPSQAFSSVCSSQVKLPEGVAKGQVSIWTNLKLKKCVKFQEKTKKKTARRKDLSGYPKSYLQMDSL